MFISFTFTRHSTAAALTQHSITSYFFFSFYFSVLTMMLRDHAHGWSLLFLAAVISDVHLQRNDHSVPPASEFTSEVQIYRPVMHPSEAVPPIGTYTLKNLVGKPCIKATMGAEYIVIEKKKTWYFNLDPSRVTAGGYCGKEAAVLSLTLPDNTASLQFTFKKEENIFYVDKVTVHVSPLPVCQGCANKTYSGLVVDDKLFAAATGQSFKCKSENLLLMSSELRIKLVRLQMQAFNLTRGQYGKGVECWADFSKRAIPIIVGATVVGLFLIAVLTFLFIRDRHRREGYDSL
ncbi:lysosome-associated membrane glycoprotein 3 [Etheostoma cragini]|uniref:lysosome-associated membrane glycoprotein 3 n=1 Tax=Etheostoma cragini TaxID=417921 RepID=UPI00155DE34E|nr:lysosome-associated membrane glycoprotein 3 [Etheostoma cragini]